MARSLGRNYLIDLCRTLASFCRTLWRTSSAAALRCCLRWRIDFVPLRFEHRLYIQDGEREVALAGVVQERGHSVFGDHIDLLSGQDQSGFGQWLRQVLL